MLAVLLNRAFFGIVLVTDAASSQSRADILGIALAVTNILAGLVWLSIKPKILSSEILYGVECKQLSPQLSNFTASELLWVWNSLLEATCCKSLVVVYGNKCLLQIGVAAESRGDVVPVLVQKLSQGSLYKNAMKVGKQNYLANLSLYPGRVELSFLPSNTQSVILQPIGDMGIVIIGGDTVRGFTNLDQTWISSLADKLDATLSKTLM